LAVFKVRVDLPRERRLGEVLERHEELDRGSSLVHHVRQAEESPRSPEVVDSPKKSA
jgi:hypothetical protein